MVSTQESGKGWLRSEVAEYMATFRVWRQKPFKQKLVDVVCAIILVVFMFIITYLIAIGSEYGGNG